MFKTLLVGLLGVTLSAASNAGVVLDKLPQTIDSEGKFVFYSHGFIVEGTNPKPVDTRNGWGLYDFPKIKQALSDDSYTLIASHRPKDTDPFKYATALNEQIRTLVDAGVDTKNITIIGFSRGAFITGLTSDKVSDLEVNTILLAGCGRLVWKAHTDVKVYGHVLSVYEKTDGAGSCERLKQKSRSLLSFTEVEINTGLSHGAFYRPIPEWLKPVKQWIHARGVN